MKKSLHLFLAVMAILVLVVSACAPATPAPTEPPAPTRSADRSSCYEAPTDEAPRHRSAHCRTPHANPASAACLRPSCPMLPQLPLPENLALLITPS